MCMVLVKAAVKPGGITLQASSAGLQGARASFKVV